MYNAQLNGTLVRQLRTDKLITQAQLAELSGIRVETLCRLESGKRPAAFKTVHKLANALNVDATTLVIKDAS